METISQVLLFAPGPFYCYPWKPFFHKLVGETYSVALKHFKAGHYGSTNLAGHFACLFVQLFGNFGFLRVLDEKYMPQPIPGVRLLSALSGLSWSLYLLRSPAPAKFSFASTAAIALAYAASPSVSTTTYENAVVAGVLSIVMGTNFLVATKKLPLKELVKFPLVPLATLGWRYLPAELAGSQVQHTQKIQLGLAAYLTLMASINNPVEKIVLSGMVLCRLAAIVTQRDELFYLGYAFTASFIQGVIHSATNEKGTLIVLGQKGGQIACEYAHVVYFPNILLHTIYDKLFKKQ